MAKDVKSRTAQYDYKCQYCNGIIEKGTEYICVTDHYVSHPPVKNSKKIYHGTVYHRDVHHNKVERYHIDCYW